MNRAAVPPTGGTVVEDMQVRTYATLGMMTLAALAFLPAPATADTVADATVCDLTCMDLRCPQFAPRGGVVGATIEYANDVSDITCDAAAQEAAIVRQAADASCSATTTYAVGADCSLVVCKVCPYIQADSGSTTEEGSTGTSASWCCLPPGYICDMTGGGGGGGVVGDTIDYGVTMTAIGCNAALDSAAVGAEATFGYCNATGEYLFGNEGACTIYWAN